ncbi:MAG: hypothetical protein ACRDYB_15010, partial [Acidimicrobiales bacterium]
AVAERVAEVEAQEVEGLEPGEIEAITVAAAADSETDSTSANGQRADVPPLPTDGDSRVEELFARIRGGRVVDPADPGPTAESGSAEAEGSSSSVATDTDRDPETERLMTGRDDLLDPIIAKMARRLKRAMQDDQNQLLHRLRSDAGEYRQELLASEDDQRRGLVEASVDFLGDAFDAGEAFARDQLGPEATSGPDATEVNRSAVGSRAQELADTVVTLLRRKLLEEDTEGPGPTEEEAAELVSAAYREWRGERIERLVGDHVIGAFSSGVRAASGKAPLQWIASGSDESCADCDDNALSEGVAEGERFPTGHLHPPAHAGCRCLVVPTTT